MLITITINIIITIIAPGGSAVNNRHVKQDMWVPSLGQEDPLEKEMATHSSIGDPTDIGAWWAVVHGSQKSPDTT